MTEPSRIAVAIGLAALGRQVLCVRPWDEPTRETEAAIIEALKSSDGFRYQAQSGLIANTRTHGSVLLINAGNWERALGREYHHFIGGIHLRADQRANLQPYVRLKL